MKIKFILLSIFALLIFSPAPAQDLQQKEALETQLDKMIESGTNYQDYKVILKSSLYKFKNILSDSINNYQNVISVSKTESKQQLKKIAELEKELQEVKTDLDIANESKDKLEIFTFSINKNQYNSIVFSMIGGLFTLMFLFLALYLKSFRKIGFAFKTLRETENEFAEYKKRALKKEQQLTRQLQDEINKRVEDTP